MEKVYACSYVEKDVERDSYEHGCTGDRSCMMAESCNIEADSLPGLIKAIGDRFCLDMDDIWLPGEDGVENYIGYNRLEDSNGDVIESNSRDFDLFKAGKLDAWLADYTFHIEIREVSGVPTAEFADIKHHD